MTGPSSARRAEVDRKLERLARLAHDTGSGGILLTTHWNLAWATAGASNRIDVSREAGAGALFVTAEGRRYVLANAIEMPRLQDEALAGLDFEPVEFPWIDERADPALVAARAARLVGRAISADAVATGTTSCEPAIGRLRTELEPEELTRLCRLGSDAGRVCGDVLHYVPTGVAEDAVTREVGAALLRAGMMPLVLLAAGDSRLLRYRHPIPTAQVWQDRLMVAVCAERDGLVVALSRLLSARRPAEEFARRLSAAQGVFTSMLDASVEGASAASLYRVAADAYASRGFAGEVAKHHQGGAIGYRSREWIAHPASSERISRAAALAWNPSVTGVKVEDTCLVTSAGVEVITSSPGWPVSTAIAQGRTIALHDHLVLDPG
jgi:antitoxin VapB